jgi:5-methylcytosine-specific restriction endonuclease McrA
MNEPRECRRCGQLFDRWQDYAHPGSAATHCHPCYLTVLRERDQANAQRRRERQNAAAAARRPPRTRPVGRGSQAMRTLRAEVLRTATLCAICGEPLDRSPDAPRSRQPSVDHIIPTSMGGALLDPTNLRAAHIGCNSRHHLSLLKAVRHHNETRRVMLVAAQWLDERLNC